MRSCDIRPAVPLSLSWLLRCAPAPTDIDGCIGHKCGDDPNASGTCLDVAAPGMATRAPARMAQRGLPVAAQVGWSVCGVCISQLCQAAMQVLTKCSFWSIDTESAPLEPATGTTCLL
jgi:hypothetical protein